VRSFTSGLRIARLSLASYNTSMKTLTVRLPEALVAHIEAESRARKVTKSDVIRERLSAPSSTTGGPPPALQAISHLIGAVKGLPADLSSNKKKYLKAGYGHKRPR
jgi:hypothetical protein